MSRVLVTHAFYNRADPRGMAAKKPYPPLGTLLAAATIREAGFEVELCDLTFDQALDELQQRLAVDPPRFVVICDDLYNHLIRLGLRSLRLRTYQIIRMALAQNCTVICCSSDATVNWNQYLRKGAHFVLTEAGELGLVSLLNGLQLGMEDFQHIPGIAYRQDGKMVKQEGRQVRTDPDQLPMPAWDLVRMDRYREVWEKEHNYFSLAISSTNGWQLSSLPGLGSAVPLELPVRSPKKVVSEVSYLLTYFQPDHLAICDETSGLHAGWLREFALEVQERKLKFRYSLVCKVDQLLRPKTTEALVESGVDTVWIRAESGSQRILDAMDTGVTLSQIREATELLRSHGIRVGFLVRFGFPGETEAEVEETLQLVLELLPDELGISLAHPLPGTPYFEEFKKLIRKRKHLVENHSFDLIYARIYPEDYYLRLSKSLMKLSDEYREFGTLKKGFRLLPTDDRKKNRSNASTFPLWPASLMEGYRLIKQESAE